MLLLPQQRRRRARAGRRAAPGAGGRAPRSTTRWLAREPQRWETNGGGEGGADDKRLARIQFAHATTAAFAAALVPKAPSARPRKSSPPISRPDGSWRLDSSDSIGSPATYGTALATVFARRTLVAPELPSMKERIARADRWLARSASTTCPMRRQSCLLSPIAPAVQLPDNCAPRVSFCRKARDATAAGDRTSRRPPSHSTRRWPARPHALPGGVLARRADRAAKTTLDDRDRERAGLSRRQQLADGSWNETTRPAGQTSYAQRISTTAWALLALVETRARTETSRSNPESPASGVRARA